MYTVEILKKIRAGITSALSIKELELGKDYSLSKANEIKPTFVITFSSSPGGYRPFGERPIKINGFPFRLPEKAFCAR